VASIAAVGIEVVVKEGLCDEKISELGYLSRFSSHTHCAAAGDHAQSKHASMHGLRRRFL
jgi:hypothetical protein